MSVFDRIDYLNAQPKPEVKPEEKQVLMPKLSFDEIDAVQHSPEYLAALNTAATVPIDQFPARAEEFAVIARKEMAAMQAEHKMNTPARKKPGPKPKAKP